MNQNVQIQQLLEIFNVYPSMKFDVAARYLYPFITHDEIDHLQRKILREKLLRLIDKRTQTFQITEFGKVVIENGGWVRYQQIHMIQTQNVWEKVWPATT
jgi:hypothetical protein